MPQNGLTRVSDTAGEHLARPGSLPSETSRRWLWYGFGVALVWLWCGLEVALGWLCTPEYMPTIWLCGGFGWLKRSRFRVQGSRFDVGAERLPRLHAIPERARIGDPPGLLGPRRHLAPDGCLGLGGQRRFDERERSAMRRAGDARYGTARSLRRRVQ